MAEVADHADTESIDTIIDEASLDHPADEYLLPRSSDQTPTLSVVMPTLNEEAGVAECITQIKNAIEELGVPAEVVVSDSSTDRTPDIARRMGAIVVEPDESGYGYAYRYAFDVARGDYIAMGDADTTYDFEQIPRLLEPVRNGAADVVMGSRLDGEIEDGAMPPLHQYVGNPLLTKFLNVFYDVGVSDAHSGFRVFTRDALETMDLESDGMEFASEMIMEAGARDLVIEELPIVYHEREGEETLDSFRDGWRHVKFMLVNAPSYLFHIPAGVLTLLGVVTLFGSLLFTGDTVGSVYIGHHTALAGSLFLIIGSQIGALAVFSAVAGNPIRQPSDPVTNWFIRGFRLEHGATVGLCVLIAGVGFLAYYVAQWVNSGFVAEPAIVPMMTAFTVVVVGSHLLFSSFFLSLIGGNTQGGVES